MRSRLLFLLALLAAGAAAAPRLAADDFPELDLVKLQAKAKDYRHRAELLRRMVGAREAKIGEAQSQADALIQQARAQAQARAAAAAAAQSSAQQTAQFAGIFTQFLPGGDSMGAQILKSGVKGVAQGAVSAADAQAQQAGAEGAQIVAGAQSDSDTLMAQAATLQGEKKKLAYKARQYEQLADSLDMLAAGEVLRRRAQEQTQTLQDIDKQIESDRAFVKGLTVW